jgi:hypothetical protein
MDEVEEQLREELDIKEEPTFEGLTNEQIYEQARKLKELEKKDRYNAYHRKYYANNKDKYNKHCQPGRKRGQRGKNVKLKYKCSILNGEGEPMLTQQFKSLREISKAINLPINTTQLIYRGKYKNGKTHRTKQYKKFLISRIEN